MSAIWPSRWLQLLAIAAIALVPPAPANAQMHEYRIDPSHSRIAFLVEHAGFSRAIGTFSGITGSIDFDSDDWSRSQVRAVVPIASLDLGDDDWNQRMRERRFFRVDRYPDARFVSRSVEPVDDRQIRITGELTVRGRSREIGFIATINADRSHPMTFKRTLGASARLELARADFGLGAYPGVVGATVEVLIELEAIRQPRRSDPADETDSENAQQPESESARQP